MLRPILDSGAVRLTGGVVSDRAAVNREVSLADGLEKLEAGGNIHNLRVAAGESDGYRPTLTLDADVHKWVEAAAWELRREPTAELASALDEVVGLLLRAQGSDGYLNSWFQVEEPERKLQDLTRGCEMYCAGHFIEAAVALNRATGDRRLLDGAIAFANLLDAEFGPQGGREGIDGHEEIELALVELARQTGETRYLELARTFVDRRGHGLVGPGVFGPRYYQDHEPVREASTLTGHAVRAMYLNTAAADLVLETGDAGLLSALERQWEAMVSSKMYLTGGLGSRERDEAIGEPFELPPDRAYAETCAAAGLLFWNWKMLQATGDSKYADLLERSFYNAFLAGVSLDGRQYFYANPLEVRADYESPHESEWSGETAWYISPAPEQATAYRRPWFRCACCPPNVMRVLSSIEQYVATTSDTGIQLHQFTPAIIEADIAGSPVKLTVSTEYPWHGTVTATVTETTGDAWELSLRVPGWAEGATVEVDGEAKRVGPGYARVRRVWTAGDTVVLRLPLTPRLTAADPRVSASYGSVAIERGPLVYCVEHVDNPGLDLGTIRISPTVELREVAGPDLLPGLVAVEADVTVLSAAATAGYRTVGRTTDTAAAEGKRTVTAIPYFTWANRTPGAMRVWIPT
ncbi:MAG TPA: beta-L-arabinofuranosidase domain-containing protein [Naasia sp.]